MSSLAVRSSLLQNSDATKKSHEIRYALLQLPPTKVFTGTTEITQFKNDYTTAKAVDQQLLAVNKLIGLLTSEKASEISDEVVCQVLSDLYFRSPLKHPLRSILSKALHKASSVKGDLITKSIKNAIIEHTSTLSDFSVQTESDVDEISSFVVSLNACFDNFPEATAAIKSYFQTLLITLHRFIDIFMKMLHNKDNVLSPARRSKVFVNLHHVIRVVLSGVQQLQDGISDASILEPIVSQCWIELMENPAYFDSPVDTKINCGILKVNYDRLFSDIFAPKEKILCQFDAPKEIFYAIAVINTTVEKDFVDPNYFPALKAIVEQLIAYGKEFTIDSCLIMAVTRALVQCTKKLLSLLRKVSLHADSITYLQQTIQECLAFVWINVQHSVDCVRYLTKDLLKNLLRLSQEQSHFFGTIVDEIISTAKSNGTSETLACLLLDYLCQVFTTQYVLVRIPDIQQRILENLFNDSCWSECYEQLMSKNSEIGYDNWCARWIQPLMRVDSEKWMNDFDRLKTVRNLFERALKTKPEAAEYILADENISIEIYLFVLWIMRRSGRKIYAPESYTASADSKVIYAKVHPSDEIRILAFRILIECHKLSSPFPDGDLREILEFFRYNCNTQNPSIRQQINVTMKRTMARIDCGYTTAKRTPSQETDELCSNYERFLFDLIDFCVDSCLFDGSNFGRRATGLTCLLYTVETWQKIVPENRSIYTQKLWVRLQKMLSDSYTVNKDVAIDILMLCWRFYPANENIIHSMQDLRKFVTTFRPYDTMIAAHYLVFCTFSHTYFESYYGAVMWCENLLNEGIIMAKKSLLQMARYNALYGLVLCIRNLLLRVDFTKLSEPNEIASWRSFFARMITKCRELTDVAAPVVNSSAPEGHLPNDLNDVSHYLSTPQEQSANASQIKVTSQMILLCAWRTVREAALLLGEISLRIPLLSSSNPNGLIEVDQLTKIGGHFQQLLIETKHRGAFEQAFLGFSNLCLRLWRSHEPELHSYPIKLVEKIAKIISGESTDNDPDAELDLKKLCVTRRSAGVPFMVQGVVTTESQVCSSTALTFCMRTFLNIAINGPVEESRTHSLNILRSLFRCAELGEAVSEYISDGIECSIRGYSAPSWPERNSSTLLFSALMIRVFGVQRSKVLENLSMKNKMTGRVFFIRYPKLYDFFYVELKSASEAIERNERPPRLHPLLLLISRLYPSAREGSDSNLTLSTYIPFISTCSSSSELVTRQLSAKSMVALIPSANVMERLFSILTEIRDSTPVNAIHGYLLQILYLIGSTKQQNYDIDIGVLKEFAGNFVHLKLPENNVIANTYLEILLEILLIKEFYPLESTLLHQLVDIRDKFIDQFAKCSQYGMLTQSYVQKAFTVFNLLLSINFEHESNQLSTISTAISSTQNELIETQLDIKYLLLCQTHQKTISSYDYSRYETELVKFVAGNQSHERIIQSLLPSTKHLYLIMNNRNEFYPFGVIKAYEILSILVGAADAFEKDPELIRLTAEQLIEVIERASEQEGVDDITEAMWKYLTAHLTHIRFDASHVTAEQIANIVMHSRNSTQSYKSSGLRQTATQVFPIIAKFMATSSDLELLIDFVELLLSLLRDDDVFVRNRTSDIVMDLIHGGKNVQKVIPLAAEDELLQWIDSRFVAVAKTDAWSKWLDLLRRVHSPLSDQSDAKADVDGNNDDNNLVDVDIFDDTEPNTFDETIYTSHKCYTFLTKHIENATLDASKKDQIRSEFASLHEI